MKKTPAWLILCIVALVAGAALGLTNALTMDEIDQQAVAAAEEARKAVMTEADEFAKVDVPGGAAVDSCYQAKKGGETIGHVVQVTVKGYGGPIEVIVGRDANGELTGVSCGGSAFSETPGLGAKVKEEKFSGQFPGMQVPVELAKNGGQVDSVTAASISSGAVCKAINLAAEFVAGLN